MKPTGTPISGFPYEKNPERHIPTPLTPEERDSVDEFFQQELKASPKVTTRIWYQLVTLCNQLRAEVEREKAVADARCLEQMNAVAALRAEVAELHKDKERLDWLEKGAQRELPLPWCFQCEDDEGNKTGKVIWEWSDIEDFWETLRAAIAARKEEAI